VLPSLHGRLFSKVKSDNASVSQTMNTGHTEAHGEKLMGSPATGTLNGSVRNVFFSLQVALMWLIITFCIRVDWDAILEQGTEYLNYVLS
jgi:hypothetical protein